MKSSSSPRYDYVCIKVGLSDSTLWGGEGMISPNTQHSTWSKVPWLLCRQHLSPSTMTRFSRRAKRIMLSEAVAFLSYECIYMVWRLISACIWMENLRRLKKACWYGQTKCLHHSATKKKSHNRLPGIQMADYKKVSIKERLALCAQVLLRTGLTPVITHSQSHGLVSSPVAASNKTSRQPQKRFSAVPPSKK